MSCLRFPGWTSGGASHPSLDWGLLQTLLVQNDYHLYQNGRPIPLEADFDPVLPVDVVFSVRGGKGGFGSMLRALGAQIEKTTNRDACRDLSGRRLRDINEEEQLKRYVAAQSQREQEAAEKKQARLAKLERLVKNENKHVFHDPKYDQARSEATERVHEAMEAAPKLKKPDEASLPSTSGKKRKSSDPTPVAPAKKGLWMGVDLGDSDLESSEDDDDDEAPEKDKKQAIAVKN